MRIENLDDPSSSPQRCEQRLDVLRPYLKPGGVGAELGVFKGSFVDYLLTSGPKRLYLVDPWFRAVPKWTWAAGNQSTRQALVDILVAFQPEIDARIVEPRIDFSEDFMRSLPDGHLDWVYIDSTHTYEHTKLEISLSLAKVKKGGYIMGDDYNSYPDAYHKGVFLAVQEMERAGLIEVLVREVAHQFVARAR